MLVERSRQGDVPDLRSGAGQSGRRVFEQLLRARLHPRPEMRAAEADARRGGIVRQRLVRAAEKDIAVERDVLDRARDETNGVERPRGFLHAHAADVAPGRAIADRAAERRRAYRRAGGLGADRERHHEVTHRRGRALRRAAGRARSIERVARLARKAVRELRRDGLAHEHAARLAGERDDRGVAAGPMAGVDGRAHLGRHVAGVYDVLDAERYAAQRAAPAAPVERPRLRERLLRVEVLPRQHLAARAPRCARCTRARSPRSSCRLQRRRLPSRSRSARSTVSWACARRL